MRIKNEVNDGPGDGVGVDGTGGSDRDQDDRSIDAKFPTIRVPEPGERFFGHEHIFALIVAPQPGNAASAAEINDEVNATLRSFDKQNASARGKAAGFLAFPSVIKAGIGLGGEYGEGPAGYYSLASASFGFQLGVQSRSVIIILER